MSIRLKNGAEVRLVSGRELSSGKLEAFYALAYPDRAAALYRHRQWMYESLSSLRSDAPLAAVSDADRIVGHAGFLPATVGWRDTRVQGAWFVDYFVLPEYRGSGLGGILIREVMQVAPLVLAIGATRASTPVFRRFGWRRLPQTFYLALPIRASRLLDTKHSVLRAPMLLGDAVLGRLLGLRAGSGDNDYRVEPVDAAVLMDWGKEHDAQQHDKARVIRDGEFLSWRILDYPFGGEFTLHAGASGAALVRTFNHRGYRRANILALPDDNLGSVLRGIVSWALREQIDYIALICSGARAVRAARRWLPFCKAMPLWVHGHDAALVDELEACSQGWEYIDSDIDLGRVDSRLERS